MPIYEFKNKITNEITEVKMSIKDKEQYLIDNPDLESYFSTPIPLGDAIRLGLKKPDGGFNEMMSKIVERTPGAQGLNDKMSRSVHKKYNFT